MTYLIPSWKPTPPHPSTYRDVSGTQRSAAIILSSQHKGELGDPEGSKAVALEDEQMNVAFGDIPTEEKRLFSEGIQGVSPS